MGELRRTMEQTYLTTGNPDAAYTQGFVYGLGKTIGRTVIGAYEIVTFPIPDHGSEGYGPILKPANPVYPDSYTPKIIDDPTYHADSNLGFGGGDIAPWFPGSRFSIFD
jgi:putative exosortase-associated protein (TIGR04073 family)